MTTTITTAPVLPITFNHQDLVSVRVKGHDVTPDRAIAMLSTGEAWIGDVTRVTLSGLGGWSWAKAWQRTDGTGLVGFRIGAGAYGDLTVLKAGAC